MREIRFRGFGKDAKRWIYGSLLDERSVGIVAIQDEKCHVWEVDPESVGQFTGLLDADGREIYEGDIVRFKEAYKGALGDERVHDVVGVVSYVYCEFKIVSDGTSELWAPCLMDGVTVIGNVHDTPELLEDKDA